MAETNEKPSEDGARFHTHRADAPFGLEGREIIPTCKVCGRNTVCPQCGTDSEIITFWCGECMSENEERAKEAGRVRVLALVDAEIAEAEKFMENAGEDYENKRMWSMAIGVLLGLRAKIEGGK